MLDKLFKKLKKNRLLGWHRATEEPLWIGQPATGRRRARWFNEELSIARFGNNMGGIMEASISKSMNGGPDKDERKEAKPKDVFKELNGEMPSLSLDNLDEKIKAIQKRRDFMVDEIGTPATEEKQVLAWLEARKKGVKKDVFKDFTWPVTTTDKVAALLKKYKLQETSFQQYTLAVPAEAIDEMEKFVDLYRKVSDDDPEFILIIEDTPKARVQRRDPIILATSPFGKFLHVIGAWDKEVEIMHELYMKGK